MGNDIKFVAATEPTNIIWENRHIKGASLYGRVTAALLIIFLMLLISFFAIYSFKKTSINAGAQFPSVKCSVFIEKFGDELQDLAGIEYDDW